MRPILLNSSRLFAGTNPYANVHPTTAEGVRVRHEISVAMARFLMVEAEVGANFAKAANEAHSTREALHYRRLARRAYDTAMNMVGQTMLEKAEAKTLARALERLNSALGELGDPL